jgi:hypothetical protein
MPQTWCAATIMAAVTDPARNPRNAMRARLGVSIMPMHNTSATRKVWKSRVLVSGNQSPENVATNVHATNSASGNITGCRLRRGPNGQRNEHQQQVEVHHANREIGAKPPTESDAGQEFLMKPLISGNAGSS